MHAVTATKRADAGDLCAAVCTFNSMRTLPRVIESLRGVADRVVIIDSGSTDGTVAHAEQFGCEVLHRDWQGMLVQRRRCLEAAGDARWILLLDSDESLEPSLQRAIGAMLASDDPSVDAYEVRRMVHFEGAWLHHTFQPEFRVRLVRGGRAKVIGSGPAQGGIHDQLVVPGRVGRLDGVLRHASWRDMADFWERSVRYARDAARTGERGGRPVDAVLRPALAFLKQFVLRSGWRDGRRGFMLAVMLSIGNAMKQVELMHKRWHGGFARTPDDRPM
jgi:glycosyltransferase involved in cell wall biosynthesis